MPATCAAFDKTPPHAAAVVPGTDAVVRIARALLRRGVLALPAGDRGSVIELSPPVVLTEAQADFAVSAVVDAVHEEVAR